MDDNQKYQRARERVQEIKGFYVHFMVFLIVQAGLAFINYRVMPTNLWFYWPLLGWGIGICIHGVSVFGFFGLFSHEWEEKKIREIMEKENHK